MSRSGEYRRFAKECLELARTAVSERSKATLLQMAQVWARLADEHAQQESGLTGVLLIRLVCQLPPSLRHFLQNFFVARVLGFHNQAITILGELEILRRCLHKERKGLP
jgi:hypothetical protein